MDTGFNPGIVDLPSSRLAPDDLVFLVYGGVGGVSVKSRTGDKALPVAISFHCFFGFFSTLLTMLRF